MDLLSVEVMIHSRLKFYITQKNTLYYACDRKKVYNIKFTNKRKKETLSLKGMKNKHLLERKLLLFKMTQVN